MAKKTKTAPPVHSRQDEPPYSDTIPPSRAEFDRVLGRAIASWQNVEMHLCDVFKAVSTCRNKNVASAIFFSPQNFNEKVKLVRNAARLVLTEPHLGDWETLRKAVIEASKARNCFAHFHMVFQSDYDDLLDQSEPTPTKIILTPNLWNPNNQFSNRDDPKPTRYEIADIKDAIATFNLLANQLRVFSETIVASP